jgi:hypothetical protein
MQANIRKIIREEIESALQEYDTGSQVATSQRAFKALTTSPLSMELSAVLQKAGLSIGNLRTLASDIMNSQGVTPLRSGAGDLAQKPQPPSATLPQR